MSDLIRRQAAIDAINRAVTKEVARWSVKELPSAEVVEVVRCKDCKFNDGVAYCEMHLRDVKGDDFCSWAEVEKNMVSVR